MEVGAVGANGLEWKSPGPWAIAIPYPEGSQVPYNPAARKQVSKLIY